jgi:hypothetical protein
LSVLIALAAAAEPAVAQGGGGVIVVGDSLEVGTSPYLKRYLPGVQLTVDAVESRPSGDAVQALHDGLRASHSVIVFDAGVNDDPAQPGVLAGDLRAVDQLAGGRCVVVATVSRPPYNGVGPEGLNGAISSFAGSRPNTQLVDWRAAALANPGLINSDGVHPTPAGYQLRARLIARGIGACLGAAPPPAAPPQRSAPPQAAPLPSALGEAARREARRALAARLLGEEVLRQAGRILASQGALPLVLLLTAF